MADVNTDLRRYRNDLRRLGKLGVPRETIKPPVESDTSTYIEKGLIPIRFVPPKKEKSELEKRAAARRRRAAIDGRDFVEEEKVVQVKRQSRATQLEFIKIGEDQNLDMEDRQAIESLERLAQELENRAFALASSKREEQENWIRERLKIRKLKGKIVLTPLEEWAQNETRLRRKDCIFALERLRARRIQVADFTAVGMRKNMCKMLAIVLLQHEVVQELHLGANPIGDEGLMELKKPLCFRSTLKTIGLQGCSLTDACIPTLAEALSRTMCGIEALLLSNNYITDKGILELVPGLLKSKHLYHLDLRLNMIGNDGILALADVVRKNHRLTHISVDGNLSSVAGDSSTQLDRALRDNNELYQMKFAQGKVKGAFMLKRQQSSLNSNMGRGMLGRNNKKDASLRDLNVNGEETEEGTLGSLDEGAEEETEGVDSKMTSEGSAACETGVPPISKTPKVSASSAHPMEKLSIRQITEKLAGDILPDNEYHGVSGGVETFAKHEETSEDMEDSVDEVREITESGNEPTVNGFQFPRSESRGTDVLERALDPLQSNLHLDADLSSECSSETGGAVAKLAALLS